MKYIKQLDSIRAIAVIFVVISHWIPKLNILPWGEIGVDIFFVLSGFLISTILFENKKLNDDSKVSKGIIVKNFIIRRTLRIFPIYYLMVLVHYLVSDYTATTVKQNIAFYISYTSNILFFRTGNLDGIASHFWSLAAEEQFYLFWPWVILLIKRQHLPFVIFAFILIGIIFPVVIGENSAILTPACFSAFGLGAFLAYIKSEDLEFKGMSFFLLNYLAITSVILLFTYPFLKNSFFQYVTVRLPISIITLWIINYCLYLNDIRFLNFCLNNKSLIFIGKISYGVYIYHTIIPWIWSLAVVSLKELGVNFHSLYFFAPKSLHNEIDLIIKFSLLIGIAWMSWIIIESPINSLKKKFEFTLHEGKIS